MFVHKNYGIFIFVQSASFIFNFYLSAGEDFCCLLITFANSFDPDQARHFVDPDLDSNCMGERSG